LRSPRSCFLFAEPKILTRRRPSRLRTEVISMSC